MKPLIKYNKTFQKVESDMLLKNYLAKQIFTLLPMLKERNYCLATFSKIKNLTQQNRPLTKRFNLRKYIWKKTLNDFKILNLTYY